MGNKSSTQSEVPKVQSLKEILRDPKKLKMIKQNTAVQFKTADKDRDNFLDLDEFAASCKMYNLNFGHPDPTDRKMREAFDRYDRDKDGKLNLDEYTDMVLEVLRVLAEVEQMKKPEGETKIVLEKVKVLE